MTAIQQLDLATTPANDALEILLDNFREELVNIEELMYANRFDIAVRHAEKIVRVLKSMGELVA